MTTDPYLAEGVFSVGFCSSSVILLTFSESFPDFFLMATSNPLQGSKEVVLQAPSLFFSQVSLSFLDQSSLRDLSRAPVLQQLRALFSLQI